MKTRTATLGICAAVIGGVAALVGAALAAKPAREPASRDSSPPAADAQAGGPSGPTAHPTGAPTGDEGHAAPDLAGDDLGPDHRAPQAFRPDMDAAMTAAEREALRPATSAPSLTGSSTSQPAGS